MKLLSSLLTGQLDQVADEMREIFSERGHGVSSATSIDPAFRRTRRGHSALTHDLVSEAFTTASAHVGLECRPAKGGALEIREELSGGLAVLRLKSAKKRRGELWVVTNTASTWGGINEDLLIPEYPFVFAYITGSDGTLELAAAPVLDVVEGTPGHFVLGDPVWLGGPAGPSRGFVPDADDSLDELDELDEDTREHDAGA